MFFCFFFLPVKLGKAESLQNRVVRAVEVHVERARHVVRVQRKHHKAKAHSKVSEALTESVTGILGVSFIEPHSSWVDGQQLSDKAQVKGMLKGGRQEQSQTAGLQCLARPHVLWGEAGHCRASPTGQGSVGPGRRWTQRQRVPHRPQLQSPHSSLATQSPALG